MSYYHINQWIDTRNPYLEWMEAQIIDIRNNEILIHYLGWSKRRDEWIDLDSPENVIRIAPHLSKASPLICRNKKPFLTDENVSVNSLIDCLDPLNQWYQAIIVEEDMAHLQWKVHYAGFNNKWDEWLDQGSYRIADIFRYTVNEVCTKAIQTLRKQENKERIESSIDLLKQLLEEDANVEAALALAEYYCDRRNESTFHSRNYIYTNLVYPFLPNKEATALLAKHMRKFVHFINISGKRARKVQELQAQNEELKLLLSKDMTKFIQSTISTFL